MTAIARLSLVLAVALAGPVAARDSVRPAELPPEGYAGRQYVDSKGCMFVRAGRGNDVRWVPRVARNGVVVCGNPPSGQRVPVAEEVGVQPIPASGKAAGGEVSSADAGPAGYFVAVGRFGAVSDTDRIMARLSELKIDAVRGRVVGSSETRVSVFAGPFGDLAGAEAAQRLLQDKGFSEAAVIGP